MNHDKPPFPKSADQPKQAGQGSSVPKSIKKARDYDGAPEGGSRESAKKYGPKSS